MEIWCFVYVNDVDCDGGGGGIFVIGDRNSEVKVFGSYGFVIYVSFGFDYFSCKLYYIVVFKN